METTAGGKKDTFSIQLVDGVVFLLCVLVYEFEESDIIGFDYTGDL